MQPLNGQDDFDCPLSLYLCGFSPFQLYLMNKKIIKSKKMAGRRTPRKAPPAERTYTRPQHLAEKWAQRPRLHRLKSEPIYFFSVQSSSIHRKMFLASLLLHIDAEKPPALLLQRLKNIFSALGGGIVGRRVKVGGEGTNPYPTRAEREEREKTHFKTFSYNNTTHDTTTHHSTTTQYINIYISIYIFTMFTFPVLAALRLRNVPFTVPLSPIPSPMREKENGQLLPPALVFPCLRFLRRERKIPIFFCFYDGRQ